MSKNNLRRITLVKGPIWGIHSLTLIISCLLLISRLQNWKKSQVGRYSYFERSVDELKSAFCLTIYTSKQRKFVPLFDFGGIVHFQFVLVQKKYHARPLARSCVDLGCLVILTEPLEKKLLEMTREKLYFNVKKLPK